MNDEARNEEMPVPASSFMEHGVPNAPVDSCLGDARFGRPRSARFVLRYIWRHMRRAAMKSILAVLVAVLLFGVCGQLALVRQSYADICETTVITANFVGGLGLNNIPSIIRTGYINDPYYEAAVTVELNFSVTDIVITNNIERYAGEEADITYADGYDASCMEEFGEIIIVGKALAERFGLETGDTIPIIHDRLRPQLEYEYIINYRLRYPGEYITDNEILALHHSELIKAITEAARTYTVAGVVSTPSGRVDNTAFIPGMRQSGEIYGNMFNISLAPLDVAEFTLADNMRADELREYGERVAKLSGVSFLMDTSKLENPQNTLRLLESLYPVALVAALFIGAFLCCLVILQSSKEAAIMRVLGTTKRKSCALLSLEQIFLGTAGLIIGACALLIYKWRELAAISGQAVLFAALYFGVILVSAVVCSVLATRRSALELLQMKE